MEDTLSLETSLPVRSEMLGLSGKTLSVDHIYSPRSMKKICATCSTAIISRKENIFWKFNGIFAISAKFWALSKKRSGLEVKYFGSY